MSLFAWFYMAFDINAYEKTFNCRNQDEYLLINQAKIMRAANVGTIPIH